MFVVATNYGLYISGVLDNASAGTSIDLTDVNARLNVGVADDGGSLVFNNGSLSLLRIGAGTPPAQQIKHAYDTEKRLFDANTQCLLTGSSDVSSVDYDNGVLTTANGVSVDKFRDLVKISSTPSSATIVATNANRTAEAN